MPSYMLLLEETPADLAHVTPEQMQEIVERYQAWTAQIAAAGHLLGGEKLKDEGGLLLRKSGGETSVTDGPYAEAREVLGGYFVISAESYDDAARIARGCPHLEFGRIRIREIDPMPEPAAVE
jgi:hypothetical protein